MATAVANNIGKVMQVIGPVLDVEFEAENLPEIYNALRIDAKAPDGTEIHVVAEVQQHIGRNTVRAVAMSSTDAVVRGMDAVDTGAPTGTMIGPPVSTTSMPRTTASVDDMATARTWLRPMCCCTSTVTRIGSPDSDVALISSALYSSGRCSASNSTSSTGPMTWTTLPML